MQLRATICAQIYDYVPNPRHFEVEKREGARGKRSPIWTLSCLCVAKTERTLLFPHERTDLPGLHTMQSDSLESLCPFLRTQKVASASLQQPAAGASAVASSAERKASDIPVSEVVRLIVSKQLNLPGYDITPIVEKLEKELIANCAVLFNLQLDLSRLGLPLALEVRHECHLTRFGQNLVRYLLFNLIFAFN